MKNTITLNEINGSYLNRLENIPKTAQSPCVQTKNEDNTKKEKLTKALICLGALGATAAIGVAIYRGQFSKLKDIEFNKGFAKLKGQADGFTGTIADKLKNGDKIKLTYKDGIIQSSTRKGSVNFTKAYETINGKKIVKKTVDGAKEEINTAQLINNAAKLRVFSVNDLNNGKISVVFQRGSKQTSPIELPKYLYHITSGTSMEKISQSGVLKSSKKEQLPGVFFLDSENFLSHYGKTSVLGKDKDLISAIFRQASKSDKKLPIDEREFAIIKIPTEALLKTGKMRVRTQEDFFRFQDVINKVNKTLKTKLSLRGLCDDKIRAKFKQDVVSNGIMDEKQADKFIEEMTAKIHLGYGVNNASALSNANSVEYIFNHDVRLSDCPNIQIRKVKAADYALKGSNGKQYDITKISDIFDQDFLPMLVK